MSELLAATTIDGGIIWTIAAILLIVALCIYIVRSFR